MSPLLNFLERLQCAHMASYHYHAVAPPHLSPPCQGINNSSNKPLSPSNRFHSLPKWDTAPTILLAQNSQTIPVGALSASERKPRQPYNYVCFIKTQLSLFLCVYMHVCILYMCIHMHVLLYTQSCSLCNRRWMVVGKVNTAFYTYLNVFLYQCPFPLHTDLSYCGMSFHFSVSHSLLHAFQDRSDMNRIPASGYPLTYAFSLYFREKHFWE